MKYLVVLVMCLGLMGCGSEAVHSRGGTYTTTSNNILHQILMQEIENYDEIQEVKLQLDRIEALLEDN